MNNTRLPEFPVLDLTIENWAENEAIMFDKYCYVISQKDFEHYHLNHNVVDVNGDVYKITGRRNLGTWKRFVPLLRQYELVFQPQNRKMPVEEIKSIMLDRLQHEPEDNEYVLHVKNASTTKELIAG